MAQPETHIDVAYVANLARLHLAADEIARFQQQLDQVLDYFREIGAVDVTGVEPTAHAATVTNVFRPDEPQPSLPRAAVLQNAPAHFDDQFAVPKIVE